MNLIENITLQQLISEKISENMHLKEYDLILGLFCFLISLVWGSYKIRKWVNQEDEKENIYFNVKIIGSLIGLFVLGIGLILRYIF